VQIAVLCLDHLFQQRHLARGFGLVGRTRFDEIVDQLLTIVEIAEEVLRLFQLANRRVRQAEFPAAYEFVNETAREA